MALREVESAPNPLTRTAQSISPATLSALDAALRIAGAALVLLYAWRQYDEFDRFFGRTWMFAIFVSLATVATLIPVKGRLGYVLRAGGSGALVFGGAMLAREFEGGIAAVCGALSFLAVAAAEAKQRTTAVNAVAGLAVAAAVTFAVAISTSVLAG